MLKAMIIFSTLFIGTETHAEVTNPLDISYRTACEAEAGKITISFVGDVLIHRALYETVVNETKHFDQLWSKTKPAMERADFSVGNLEGPAALGLDDGGKDHGDIGFVYDGHVYSGTNLRFNYHPRIFSDLKSSGFDLVTSANNHANDRLSAGIDKTIDAARAIQFPTVGTRSSKTPDESFYKVVSIKGVNIAFLGCTENSNIDTTVNKQILFCYDKPEKILSIISEASKRADVDAVIVMPHWGVEYSHTPSSVQKEFARKYINAGATAVVGSHPHVLQPWEKVYSVDGREALIIYSLGNFVAGQAGLDRKTGTIAYLGLSKKDKQKAKIFGVAYTPTYRTDASVAPIGKNDPAEILDHVAKMYGAQARIEPGAELVPFMCKKELRF